MDYKKTAESIVDLVGGKENVKDLTHCVTRLRFVLEDNSKADTESVKGIAGVLGVVEKGGQYQVVIGNEVGDVFKEAVKLIGERTAGPAAETAEAEKKTFASVLKAGVDFLSSCFVPAIPVMAGSGMVKVLATLLSFVGALSMDSQTYQILNLIGDTFFYFLPVFVAINAAAKLDTDKFIAATLALILVSPNFTALATDEVTTASFLGITFSVLNYSTQALPAIFGTILLKYVDKLADKVSPKMVKVFLRPMIDLLICAPIMFLWIGPVSMVLGNAFFALVNATSNWGWLAVAINAVLFPVMVLTGTHNATIPLLVQVMATIGYDSIFLPSGMAANIAEGAAAFAVGVKTKNKELRSTAYSAGASALLGITEPALYGVNLRMKRPFVSMMIGAGVGGAIIGLFKLAAPTFATPSLLTAAIFAGHGASVLTCFLSVGLVFIETFLITFFIGFEDLEAAGDEQSQDSVNGEV